MRFDTEDAMRIVLQRKIGRDGQRGTTLIELMMAMLVLAIGFGGVTTLLVTAMASNNRASRDTTSTLLAQKVIEEISSQNVNVFTAVKVTDCSGTQLTFATAAGATGTGTGAKLKSDGTIDFTQSFAAIPSGYAMHYVDCSSAGGLATVYDVRWNVMSISSNTTARLVTAAARPTSSNVNQLGGFYYAYPVTLRGIGGPNIGE